MSLRRLQGRYGGGLEGVGNLVLVKFGGTSQESVVGK